MNAIKFVLRDDVVNADDIEKLHKENKLIYTDDLVCIIRNFISDDNNSITLYDYDCTFVKKIDLINKGKSHYCRFPQIVKIFDYNIETETKKYLSNRPVVKALAFTTDKRALYCATHNVHLSTELNYDETDAYTLAQTHIKLSHEAKLVYHDDFANWIKSNKNKINKSYGGQDLDRIYTDNCEFIDSINVEQYKPFAELHVFLKTHIADLQTINDKKYIKAKNRNCRIL